MFGKVVVGIKKVARPCVDFAQRHAKKIVCAGGIMVTALAHATDPDPSTIVDTATTTISSVETAVAGAVGFFIVVKIVKWIRK